MHKLTVLIIACLFLSGCAAYQLDSAQNELRSSFASGNYDTTADLIKTLNAKDVYKSKDQVLLQLEQGMVHHFAGNYQTSSKHFTDAEYLMEDLYSKSVSRAVKSFLMNDTALDYDGEDYEDIYLNVFKGLNFIHQNDLEGALVEVRRVNFKLSQLDQKYNGLIQSLAKADTTSTGEDKWKTGKTRVTNSMMARYLSTALYAKTNKPDDARIEHENLMKAFQERQNVFEVDDGSSADFSYLKNPESYNVLVQAFTGRAPTKAPNDIRYFHQETDTYIKISLPVLETYSSQVRFVKINIDEGETIPLDLIEEMDQVAKEVYKVKEPIIYARAVVRGFLKMLASEKLKKEAKDEDDALGSIVGFLGKVAQETTEKADLRSWQTMPGKAYATVLDLPPGSHTLNINYYNSSGSVVHSDQKIINISEDNPLQLVESIYWN